jgi:hypothetical protein
MDGWEKFPKKKKKLGGVWEENKSSPKKKKTEIRAEKGQTKKKATWDGKVIEKRILSVHHPSTLVHRGDQCG